MHSRGNIVVTLMDGLLSSVLQVLNSGNVMLRNSFRQKWLLVETWLLSNGHISWHVSLLLLRKNILSNNSLFLKSS